MSGTLFAILLTVFAGGATALGGLIGVLGRQGTRRLAFSLGFAAGVMIWVSFAELLPTATAHVSTWAVLASFFGAVAAVLVLERVLIHEAPLPGASPRDEKRQLLRMGLVTAVVLMVHNFPEGFATLMMGLHDPRLAVPLAVAIALHNIPEGIAVAAPIHRATRSRRRAFWAAALSGLTEPLGAVLGWLLLRPLLTDDLLGVVFAAVAGLMAHISLADLVPTAQEYAEGSRTATLGIVAGMAVMAISLALL